MEVLQGKEAEKVLTKILDDREKETNNGVVSEKYPEPFVSGYYQEDKRWVAFDNTSGDCWVEDYPSEKSAAKYANNL